MKIISKEIFKGLYKPPKKSHKGQNGKLTIIGGSQLFHGASLWALRIASRIIDMVFYSTVKENENLTKKLKSEIYDFICVPRKELGNYIGESDAVLIGCGMEREENTFKITQHLLAKFPHKKWIIDAGSLQMMDPEWLKNLSNVIITPHKKEFCQLFKTKIKNPVYLSHCTTQGAGCRPLENRVLIQQKAKEYGCTIVLKGPTDIICSPTSCLINQTGNEGMTKGGTGDVLAGLIAGLACKNNLFLAACAGTYINGLSGDSLYKKVGPYFNATDLCEEIPIVMGKLIK